MIEIFVCVGIMLLTKTIEWVWKLMIFMIKLVFDIILLPFKLLFPNSSNKNREKQQKEYTSYRRSALKNRDYRDDYLENLDPEDFDPEDLDMEDIFWYDELLEDDDEDW